MCLYLQSHDEGKLTSNTTVYLIYNTPLHSQG